MKRISVQKIVSLLCIFMLCFGVFGPLAGSASAESSWKKAPVITSVSQKSDSKVKISWEADPDAKKFEICEYVNGEYVSVMKVKNETKATLKNVTKGTHRYAVRAYKTVDGKEKHGKYSETVKIKVKALEQAEAENTSSPDTLGAAQTPKIKKITQDGSSVKITWSKVSGAKEYRVYEVVNGEYKKIKTVKKTSLTVKNVSTGTHAYAVAPIRKVDGKSVKGEYSGTVEIKVTASPKYRALLIAEKTFLGTDQYGMPAYDLYPLTVSDAKRMESMLKSVSGPKGGSYKVTRKTDLSYDGIRRAIQSTFADTTDNDVSLFFITTHGNSDGNGELVMPFKGKTYVDALNYFVSDKNSLSFTTLAGWLRTYVKGEVIVIIQSCGAGSAIKKLKSSSGGSSTLASNIPEVDMNAEIPKTGTAVHSSDDGTLDGSKWTSGAISAFRNKDSGVLSSGNTLESDPGTGAMRLPKFHVIVSSKHRENSYMNVSKSYGVFVKTLVNGIGTKGSSPADSSGDGIVTQKELTNYLKQNVNRDPYLVKYGETQHVQAYPSNSSYPLFKLK